jgi:ATP-dependent DNA ligase
MQVRFDGRSLSMRSRHGRACVDEFPEVAVLAETFAGRQIVLDGELDAWGPT